MEFVSKFAQKTVPLKENKSVQALSDCEWRAAAQESPSACRAPQMVRSNKTVRRTPIALNETFARDLGFEDIRIRRYRKEQRKEEDKTHFHKHATCTTNTHLKQELIILSHLFRALAQ